MRQITGLRSFDVYWNVWYGGWNRHLLNATYTFYTYASIDGIDINIDIKNKGWDLKLKTTTNSKLFQNIWKTVLLKLLRVYKWIGKCIPFILNVQFKFIKALETRIVCEFSIQFTQTFSQHVFSVKQTNTPLSHMWLLPVVKMGKITLAVKAPNRPDGMFSDILAQQTYWLSNNHQFSFFLFLLFWDSHLLLCIEVLGHGKILLPMSVVFVVQWMVRKKKITHALRCPTAQIHRKELSIFSINHV